MDIGVHQDGLVHISQITDKYIKHPLEAVSVGDIVDVKVMSVDLKKKRNSADHAWNFLKRRELTFKNCNLQNNPI